MKSERLLDAFGQIEDEFIAEADPEKKRNGTKRKSAWLKWAAVAAGLFVLIGVGIPLVGNMGKKGAGDNSGRAPGSVFMSYAGPVLPLSALTDTAGIIAERNIDFDFSPYAPQHQSYEYDGEIYDYDYYDARAIVSDEYTLTNTTKEDKVFTAVYAFTGSFGDSMEQIPTVSIAGNKVDTTLYAGRYSGGFRDENDGDDNPTRLNLKGLERWEEYQLLLEDGVYLQDALADYPVLEQSVIVYEFTELSFVETEENRSPSIVMGFKMDDTKTAVMSHGANGGSFNEKTGKYYKGFPVLQEQAADNPLLLIVLGDDITDIELRGFKEAYEENEATEGIVGHMERYEATLSEILGRIIDTTKKTSDLRYGEEDRLLNHISNDMFIGSMAELIFDHGVLAEDTMERYDAGYLEDVANDSVAMDRIFYLTFDVLIPANTSVQVDVSMVKAASCDFVGDGKSRERNGFDMMTTLGSSFTFAQQTASISNTEFVEITVQNFGFDLEKGIRQVELDLNVPHYYMEVHKVEDTAE